MRNGKTIEACDICPEALSKHGPLMGIVWLIKYNFQSEFGYLFRSAFVIMPVIKNHWVHAPLPSDKKSNGQQTVDVTCDHVDLCE